jgi:hypothetical protein
VSNFRIFIAFPDHIAVAEAAPGVEEAYDIMVADDVPAERAAGLAVAAAKSGRDPVVWARHFVNVRQAVRE